ncbi:hypothetical protein ABIE26_000392 [Pedobacter africanus]|uniref:Uncharacterized protein n=1 Tax=Pedobacter africanus TaxID=151894 RepID=A0ACC6KVD8_9SPHI|nr:hypothetical protein [Pedobacter africanus]
MSRNIVSFFVLVSKFFFFSLAGLVRFLELVDGIYSFEEIMILVPFGL